MATYAVGDVQGCFGALQCLLETADFNPQQDKLWFAGDLVNRGPQSLETLRFVISLGDSAVTVLGNHDLHLLAVVYGASKTRAKDTLNNILSAPDRDELITWLRRQKLLHVSADQQYLLSHAGLPPIWTCEQALGYASEIETLLQSDAINKYLHSMYGNSPDQWDNKLTGPERWRLITNYFTRMRFCNAAGRLELSCKLGPDQPPAGFRAWFHYPNQLQSQQKILFGHWATLNGITGNPQCIALDTGCVWGRQLSMLRLDDQQWYRCDCHK